MRKLALLVEVRPKRASARAGVNESIRSFNEREGKMKEDEEKIERRVLGRESVYLGEGSDLRSLSCGSDPVRACLPASDTLCSSNITRVRRRLR